VSSRRVYAGSDDATSPSARTRVAPVPVRLRRGGRHRAPDRGLRLRRGESRARTDRDRCHDRGSAARARPRRRRAAAGARERAEAPAPASPTSRPPGHTDPAPSAARRDAAGRTTTTAAAAASGPPPPEHRARQAAALVVDQPASCAHPRGHLDLLARQESRACRSRIGAARSTWRPRSRARLAARRARRRVVPCAYTSGSVERLRQRHADHHADRSRTAGPQRRSSSAMRATTSGSRAVRQLGSRRAQCYVGNVREDQPAWVQIPVDADRAGSLLWHLQAEERYVDLTDQRPQRGVT
jgi:hypothetical protein